MAEMGGQMALQAHRYGLAPQMGDQGMPSKVRRRTLSGMKYFRGQEAYPMSQVLKKSLWHHKASASLGVEHVIQLSRQLIF